jgi:DNA polymerase-1
MTRLYNGVRLLGSGPSVANIQKIDAGCLPMVLSMAKTGLQVDLDHFAKMETSLIEDMDRITEEVHTLTGHYINLDSGDQVSDLLFKKLGLKQARFKLTRSGDRESVEDEVLMAIQHDHPVVPLLLSYKEYSKLLGTYVQPIPKLTRRCEDNVWRMFPNLSSTRVPSGRFSCKQPNLLAMPTRTDRGAEIRKGFITKPGWVVVSVDESQIEMRVAAHSSEDPTLINIYENGEDIYSDFAIFAFKLPDKRYRDEKGWHYPGVDRQGKGPHYPAKTCVLACIYDVSAKGLLEQMPAIFERGKPVWTEDKCQDFINGFYIKYPGIIKDRRRYHKMARHFGFCWDMWGRILHVAAVRSVHPWVVGAALREVGNFPYQGGANGTFKLTMAAVWDDLEQSNMLDVVHPLLPVHDELLFECREDVADELIEAVKFRFETCAPLRVPLVASGAKAANWGSLDK